MKSSICFIISMHIKKKITILIMLTNCFRKVLIFFNKVIFIYEIISRIIWWININHLHFAQVCFAQKLQGIEVIALDVDIFTINVPPGVPSRLTDFFRSSRKVLATG